jgi:hypothetical protein
MDCSAAMSSRVPKIRFPEFWGWETKELKDVVTYTKGVAFKSQDYTNEGIRIIRVFDLGAREIKYETEKIFIEKQKLDNYEKWNLASEI